MNHSIHRNEVSRVVARLGKKLMKHPNIRRKASLALSFEHAHSLVNDLRVVNVSEVWSIIKTVSPATADYVVYGKMVHAH